MQIKNAQTAKSLGIISKVEKNDLTIALGTSEVSLFELTSAYATIANGGEAVIPYSIIAIKNDKDESLYERESSGVGKVISQKPKRKSKNVCVLLWNRELEKTLMSRQIFMEKLEPAKTIAMLGLLALTMIMLLEFGSEMMTILRRIN